MNVHQVCLVSEENKLTMVHKQNKSTKSYEIKAPLRPPILQKMVLKSPIKRTKMRLMYISSKIHNNNHTCQFNKYCTHSTEHVLKWWIGDHT